MAVSTATGAQQTPVIVPDGTHDGFVIWTNSRTDGGDIYATHLTQFGNPAPTADVPGEAPPRVAFALRGRSPASGPVDLSLALPSSARVTVRVLDAAGRIVRDALAPAKLEAGTHAIAWDGADNAGRVAPAGLYFAVASVGAEHHTLRLVRLR